MIFIYDYNYGNLNIGFLIGKLQSEIDKELLINVVYVNNNLFEVEDLGSSNISRYIGNVEGIKKISNTFKSSDIFRQLFLL